MKNNWIKKRLAAGIILLFVGTCIIPSTAQKMEKPSLPISRGHWLYVGGNGPGNYSTIQDAIDNASDGDTIFVYDDSSPYEGAIIDKAVTLIGENKETTVIENEVHVERNNTTVTGFTINFLQAVKVDNLTIINNEFRGFETGISVNSGTNVKIINNTLMNQTREGIYIRGSNDIITGNTIIANSSWSTYTGLTMNEVQNTIVSNNSFISFRDGINKGILIFWSKNNIIKNNSFVKTGIDLLDSDENTFSGNTVNGKPLIWLEGEANQTVDDAGQVFLVHCNQITVCNLTLIDVPEGITLYDTNGSNIWNNTLSWCNTGIILDSSNMNTLSQNTLMNCSSGISLLSISIHTSPSNMNTLSQNTLMNCSTGITISRSSNNTIEKNLIQKSGGSNGFSGSGICLSVSDHNIITGNNISSNFFYGIMLHNCDHNNIVNDTLVNNDYGIALFDSGHNNIINNAISNNDYGIELYSDHNSTINNTISNNDYGIEQGSHHNNIINNNISKNRVVGIYIRSSTINTALKNNFLNNQQDAFFYKSKKNTWKHNYWNRPRILPKLIFGTIEKNSKEILWFNIDWCPALRPYDIGG